MLPTCMLALMLRIRKTVRQLISCPACSCAGYLPSSGGLLALERRLSAGAVRQDTLEASHASSSAAEAAASAAAPGAHGAALPGMAHDGPAPARRWWRNCDSNVSLLACIDHRQHMSSCML